MPTSEATATGLHYRKRLFRFRVQHFGPNRADRRSEEYRRLFFEKNGHLNYEPNTPYVHPEVPNA